MMDLSAKDKTKIDAMDYEAMLSLMRNAPVGHPWFTYGPLFDYYEKRMRELRSESGGDARHVAASKSIGWGGG